MASVARPRLVLAACLLGAGGCATDLPAPMGDETTSDTATSDEPTTGGETGETGETSETGALDPACVFPDDDEGPGELDTNMDGVLGPDDLAPGEAAILAIVSDGSGATVWRQVTTDVDIWHGDGNGDQSRYGVWLTLEHPDGTNPLYTTTVFEGPVDGIAEPGSFERISTNWDHAAVERGGSNDAVPGAVELSFVEGDIASGSVSEASGPIEIIDYVLQAPSGEIVCVRGVAFNQIAAEFTH